VCYPTPNLDSGHQERRLLAADPTLKFDPVCHVQECSSLYIYGHGTCSYFLVVASDLKVDRLRKNHPTEDDKKGPVFFCKASCLIDTVETAPAAVMSQNVTNAYTLHDQSLLLTMLGMQTNDWNGERIKKFLPCRKNIDYISLPDGIISVSTVAVTLSIPSL
jgi:hypothetical protein